jgi:acyl-CoA thioesterase-1
MRRRTNRRRGPKWLPALALALVATGCQETPPPGPAARQAPRSTAAPVAPTPSAAGPLVVFLGDSLTAGLGLPADDAFPAQVGRLLAREGETIRVVNAGVSGDTSAGALRRLSWLLGQRPRVVVVEVGANDALRGQPLEAIEGNLRRIVEAVEDAGAEVLLLGMRIPPSYGATYADGFAAIFPRVAEEEGVRLVDFLLAGVGGRPELNQEDGIHPNAAGHRRMAELVAPALREVLAGGRIAAEVVPGRPTPAAPRP